MLLRFEVSPMQVFRAAVYGVLAAAGVSVMGILTGCSQHSDMAAAAAAPQPGQTSLPAATPKKAAMPGGLKANELGRIPVLMYHSVGEYRTKYDKHGLNITPATFRKHIALLHNNNFYPMTMRDALNPIGEIPAGKTPVVITFDDARGSQFRYLSGDKIDPDCALGILEEAHRKWGDDWPQRATFYVLPYSKYNPAPFWQPGKAEEKVRFLADAGYEIANHSTSHRPLNRLSEKEVAWEVKFAQDYFKKMSPKVTMDTMAVPYGIYPKTHTGRQLLLDSGNKCVLMAWGGASYAPLDKRFDRSAVLRIGTDPGEIERWIPALVKARRQTVEGMRTYVSDGDPATLTIPQSLAKYLRNPLGLQIALYNDQKSVGGSQVAGRSGPSSYPPTPLAPPKGRKGSL